MWGGKFQKVCKTTPIRRPVGLSFHIMCRVHGYCINSSFSFIIFNFELLRQLTKCPAELFLLKRRRSQAPNTPIWVLGACDLHRFNRTEVPVSVNAMPMEVAILIPLFLYKNPLQTWLQMIASVQRHLLSSLCLHFSSPVPSMNLLYSCISWWIPIYCQTGYWSLLIKCCMGRIYHSGYWIMGQGRI